MHYCKTALYQFMIRFFDDRLQRSAAALAFTTLLAMVPLLAVSFQILSLFPIFHDYRFVVQHLIVQNFIPETSKIIEHYLAMFVKETRHLSYLGTLFLVVTTILTMMSFERTFSDIWKIQQKKRKFLDWLRYWVLIAIAPIFITLMITTVSYVISLPVVRELILNALVWKGLSFGLTIFLLALLYIVIPNCPVPIRYGFIGAFIATILLEVAKRVFVFYMLHFPSYHLIYGTLAAIPLFFIWVYVLWVIILSGALVSNVLTVRDYSQ